MTNISDIPQEPMPHCSISSGFLPSVGLHRKGMLFYQESSYSFLWTGGVMFISALVIVLLPWDVFDHAGTKLGYYIAAIPIWGGLCSLAGYNIRNSYGQIIRIDRKNQTLDVCKNGMSNIISWNKIIALQICPKQRKKNFEDTGYQLNLVWAEPNGDIQRHCLAANYTKRYIKSLGHQYADLFGFQLIEN